MHLPFRKHAVEHDTRSTASRTSSDTLPHNVLPNDVEKAQIEKEIMPDKVSAFKGLGWLDRFLAIWIILAMAIGILLGNFVPSTGEALEKGKFVGVSVPVGKFRTKSV